MTERRIGLEEIGIGLSAFAIGALAGLGAVFFARRRATAVIGQRPDPVGGHAAPDLMDGHRPGPGDRAPEAFRPDPTAVPTAEERESLRPATLGSPGLVADRGSGLVEAVGAA